MLDTIKTGHSQDRDNFKWRIAETVLYIFKENMVSP